ncbi:MAG: VanZ family protein [Bacteroidia bacterium]
MFFKYNLAGITWAVVIFILCIIPGNLLPDLSWWSLLSFDKLVHAFVFGVLVFLFGKGFIRQYSFDILKLHPIKCAIIISVIYGGLLEIMQSTLLIERTGDIKDFVANTIGCSLGGFVFHRFNKKNSSQIV